MRLYSPTAIGLTVCLMSLLSLSSCGDSNNPTRTTTPVTTPPAPPTSVIEMFSLSAEDGQIRYSAPLATLSDGDSFEIEFRPTGINDGPSGFSNVVEFWLDRGPPEDGIAMGFDWFPDSQWGVYRFTTTDGFIDQPVFRLINLGGRFRTVRVRRANGIAEWLLDDESLVILDDPSNQRTVYARVVGVAADFRYQRTTSSRTQSQSQETAFGSEPCGNCRAQ